MHAPKARTVALVIVGLLYGAVLLVIAFVAAGAGHGSFVPCVLFSSPVGLPALVNSETFDQIGGGILCLFAPPILWAALFGFAARSAEAVFARLFVGAMALHYVAAVLLLTTEPYGDWSYFRKVADVAVPGIALYIVGQAALWFAFARSRRGIANVRANG